MLIDGPPGIGCAATAAIAGADLAVVVTEPTPSAAADLGRLRQRVRQLRVPLALVINRADRNGALADALRQQALAEGDLVLGTLPRDPAFRLAQQRGTNLMATAEAPLRELLSTLWRRLAEAVLTPPRPSLEHAMSTPTRLAIPITDGKVDAHFGHCTAFALLTTDGTSITGREDVAPPKHEPGVLPRWLLGQGVRVVIAGGMGERARQLLEQGGAAVVLGVSSGTPEELALRYLAGKLVSLGGSCTAHEGHGCGGH